jgi:ubiquinone/menaquinone biosynthesis C-methylase UbiE
MSRSAEALRPAESRSLPLTRRVESDGDLLVDSAFRPSSKGLAANAAYMDNPVWAKEYFDACHRDAAFLERWTAAAGSWNDKVVVDIGCGPGNLHATIGGRPRSLIGVDVSRGSLAMARELGYTTILADAHDLPLRDGCADIVALNATLHHCDDMPTVLAEAARLVAPGGVLVADHDPQLSAWDWKGLGMLGFKVRLPLYRLVLGSSRSEQIARLKSELHHRPAHGVTPELFREILEPRGFTVTLAPHNNGTGAAVFTGEIGRAPMKYRLGQALSGIDSREPTAALSLMCVATLSEHGPAGPLRA